MALLTMALLTMAMSTDFAFIKHTALLPHGYAHGHGHHSTIYGRVIAPYVCVSLNHNVRVTAGARQAHARRTRRPALRDACRRCRSPLRLRPRRGRGRLLQTLTLTLTPTLTLTLTLSSTPTLTPILTQPQPQP